MPALRPKVDHIIRLLDHVHVVFDDDRRISGLNQTVNTFDQPFDVREMQTGCRLVKDIQNTAALASACSIPSPA
jgi:hypothetical protein